ncbi:MAG TPA: heparan-alpha-glucosaminide N-acetyltransferase [Bauldia sp.]|nr:heparan-alpha-glucosaminide N-acetyltransferase [Bauldia sp.]
MSVAAPSGEISAPRPRLPAVDLARGVAIVAMVVYHTAFDLYAEGLIASDAENGLVWKLFARTVATSFLVLVGIGLVLASRGGIVWPRYWRRVALVAVGAILVSVATWFFDSETFVYFGILHQIAVASVLALPFLVAPWWVVAAAAAVIIAAPWFATSPAFGAPWLLWLGLGPDVRSTLDYVPLLPWFGAVLAGILAGRVVVRYSAVMAKWRLAWPPASWLCLAGRWSLVIYLVHQPLIFGAVHLYATAFPPSVETTRARFVGQCERAVCEAGDKSCAAYCGCVFDGLYGTDLYPPRRPSDLTEDQASRQQAVLNACRAASPQ